MRVLRSKPDLMRIALLTSLGLPACGAAVNDGSETMGTTAGQPQGHAGQTVAQAGQTQGGQGQGGQGQEGEAQGGQGGTTVLLPTAIPDGEHCARLNEKTLSCGTPGVPYPLNHWCPEAEPLPDRAKCQIECAVDASCDDWAADFNEASNVGPVGRDCQRLCDGPFAPTGTCAENTVVLNGDVDTGLLSCESGLVHRPAVVACEPQPHEVVVAAEDPEPVCTADTDCTEQPYGYCDNVGVGGLAAQMGCLYGCLTDQDCGEGAVCVCGVPYGECRSAECTSDSDCAGDTLCAEVDRTEPVCGRLTAFTCQTPEDECATSSDCWVNRNDAQIYYCSIESGTRACEPRSGVVCGRPFLIAGTARTAATCNSVEWLTGMQPSEPRVEVDPTSALNQRLAAAWVEMGLMEHASIAAFARFTLQLLQFGAPARLVAAAQQAMADEIQHAQLCFQLASAYAKQPLGPDALPMAGALDGATLQDIVVTTILEGCVGETVAALEAAEAAQHAADPAVRAVLQQIHADELRHAELAWQFLAWALGQGTAAEQAALHRTVVKTFAMLGEPVLEACREQSTALDRALLDHGVMSAALQDEVRRQAIVAVVQPCAEALLATTVTSRHTVAQWPAALAPIRI